MSKKRRLVQEVKEGIEEAKDIKSGLAANTTQLSILEEGESIEAVFDGVRFTTHHRSIKPELAACIKLILDLGARVKTLEAELNRKKTLKERLLG